MNDRDLEDHDDFDETFCSRLGGRKISCNSLRRNGDMFVEVRSNAFVPGAPAQTIVKDVGYDRAEVLRAAWLTINAMKQRRYPCEKIRSFVEYFAELYENGAREGGRPLAFGDARYMRFIDDTDIDYPGGGFETLEAFSRTGECSRQNVLFVYDPSAVKPSVRLVGGQDGKQKHGFETYYPERYDTFFDPAIRFKDGGFAFTYMPPGGDRKRFRVPDEAAEYWRGSNLEDVTEPVRSCYRSKRKRKPISLTSSRSATATARQQSSPERATNTRSTNRRSRSRQRRSPRVKRSRATIESTSSSDESSRSRSRTTNRKSKTQAARTPSRSRARSKAPAAGLARARTPSRARSKTPAAGPSRARSKTPAAGPSRARTPSRARSKTPARPPTPPGYTRIDTSTKSGSKTAQYIESFAQGLQEEIEQAMRVPEMRGPATISAGAETFFDGVQVSGVEFPEVFLSPHASDNESL